MVMVIVWERGQLKMILQDGRMMEFPANVKRDLAGWVDVGMRGKLVFAEGNLEVSHDDMTFSDSGWFKIAIDRFSSRFAAIPETGFEKEILALLRRSQEEGLRLWVQQRKGNPPMCPQLQECFVSWKAQ